MLPLTQTENIRWWCYKQICKYIRWSSELQPSIIHRYMRTHIHKYTHKLSNFRPGKKTLLFIRTGWMSNCFLGQFLLFHIYYFIIFDAESETVWTRSSYKVLRKTAALSWKLCLWAECTFVVKHPWSCRYILATSTHANGPSASEDLSSCDIMCLVVFIPPVGFSRRSWEETPWKVRFGPLWFGG